MEKKEREARIKKAKEELHEVVRKIAILEMARVVVKSPEVRRKIIYILGRDVTETKIQIKQVTINIHKIINRLMKDRIKLYRLIYLGLEEIE